MKPSCDQLSNPFKPCRLSAVAPLEATTLGTEAWRLVAPPMPGPLNTPEKRSDCFGTPNWKLTLSSAQFLDGVTAPWSTIAPENMLHSWPHQEKWGGPWRVICKVTIHCSKRSIDASGNFLDCPLKNSSQSGMTAVHPPYCCNFHKWPCSMPISALQPMRSWSKSAERCSPTPSLLPETDVLTPS